MMHSVKGHNFYCVTKCRSFAVFFFYPKKAQICLQIDFIELSAALEKEESPFICWRLTHA